MVSESMVISPRSDRTIASPQASLKAPWVAQHPKHDVSTRPAGVRAFRTDQGTSAADFEVPAVPAAIPSGLQIEERALEFK